MNLCTNAVHAMERGGTLTVLLERIRLIEGRSLSRGALSPGNYARLVIRDTGTGIPPLCSSEYSIRSSRPKVSAKEPVWVYRWCMGS